MCEDEPVEQLSRRDCRCALTGIGSPGRITPRVVRATPHERLTRVRTAFSPTRIRSHSRRQNMPASQVPATAESPAAPVQCPAADPVDSAGVHEVAAAAGRCGWRWPLSGGHSVVTPPCPLTGPAMPQTTTSRLHRYLRLSVCHLSKRCPRPLYRVCVTHLCSRRPAPCLPVSLFLTISIVQLAPGRQIGPVCLLSFSVSHCAAPCCSLCLSDLAASAMRSSLPIAPRSAPPQPPTSEKRLLNRELRSARSAFSLLVEGWWPRPRLLIGMCLDDDQGLPSKGGKRGNGGPLSCTAPSSGTNAISPRGNKKEVEAANLPRWVEEEEHWL